MVSKTNLSAFAHMTNMKFMSESIKSAIAKECDCAETVKERSHCHDIDNSDVSKAVAKLTRCTRGVRVVFSVTRMRSSNSARINKFDFRTEKSCSVHMTVFEIVAGHNVVNWMQLLT